MASQCGQKLSWVELNWLFNVTINDISVIYVTAHRCAGWLKKKLDLQSGSQHHRHFVGFFNVPIQAPTQDQPFYTVILTHRPKWVFLIFEIHFQIFEILGFWFEYSIKTRDSWFLAKTWILVKSVQWPWSWRHDFESRSRYCKTTLFSRKFARA